MTFKSISDIKIKIEAPKQTRDVVNEIDILLSGSIRTEKFEFLPAYESFEFKAILSTINQLTAFGASVKRYGLTRSLLAFADHDKTLSVAIPTIPSLETLTSDRSVKNSTDIIAAVEASVGDMVEVFRRKFTARVKNMIERFTSNGKKIDAELFHIKALKDMIAEGRVLDEKAISTRQFNLPNHDVLFEQYKLLPLAKTLFEKLESTHIPNDEKSYNAWLAAITPAFNAWGRMNNCKLDSHGQIATVDGKPLSENEISVSSNTLKNHGYTNLEEFNTIADIAATCPERLKVLNAWLDRLAGNYTQATDYLEKALETQYSIVHQVGSWEVWVTSGASYHAMLALFACSEQKKVTAESKAADKAAWDKSLEGRLDAAGCMSTRVAVLTSQYPDKMESVVARIEKLAEIAETNNAFHEDFNNICNTWYLSDDEYNDDKIALRTLMINVAKLEKLSKTIHKNT